MDNSSALSELFFLLSFFDTCLSNGVMLAALTGVFRISEGGGNGILVSTLYDPLGSKFLSISLDVRSIVLQTAFLVKVGRVASEEVTIIVLACLCGSLAQCALSQKRLSAGPGFNP